MSCGSLASSTLLMDDYGGSYRYHTLLRDFLQRELAVREPELVPTLHRRAAAWYQANHAIERAVDHAFAAGDPDLVATLVGNGFVQYHWSGHRATIRAWARRLGIEASRGTPMARRTGSLGGDRRGRCSRRRSVSRISPSAERSTGSRPTARLRSRPGGRCSEPAWFATGADDALANATRAVELEGDHGSWRDFALWQLAFARLTIGDLVGRGRRVGRRGRRGADRRATSRSCTACSDTARWWPLEQGAWDAAAALIAESDAIDPAPQIDGYLSSVPSRAVRIRLMIHRGDIAGARRELARATSLRPLLTAAAPAGAVQLPRRVRPRPCRVDDPAGARALVRPGERRDPRSPRPRRPPCRGGRAPGDRCRPGARARRGRHEPHGRRAPRACRSCPTTSRSRRSGSDSASRRRR